MVPWSRGSRDWCFLYIMETTSIIYVSSFQPADQNTTKDRDGKRGSDGRGAHVDDSNLVPKDSAFTDRFPAPSPEKTENVNSTVQTDSPPSTSQENPINSLPCLGPSLSQSGISPAAQEIILHSWKKGTKKQYRSYINQWSGFCSGRDIDPMHRTVPQTIEFLQTLYESGHSYSAINTARSALSTFIITSNGNSIGTHPSIRRYLKGVYNLRPSLPKYQFTWDVNIVLQYLNTFPATANRSMEKLTYKLVIMLIALITGQRCQTIHLMRLDNMQVLDDKTRFIISDHVKQSRPGREQPVLVLPKYTVKNMCAVATLNEYINRTSSLRSDQYLLISLVKPHKRVSKNTIARWIKNVLRLAGIDMSMYTAHSTWSSSSSAEARYNIPITSIMKAASWSNDNVFTKFYNKPVNKEAEYGTAMLSNMYNN